MKYVHENPNKNSTKLLNEQTEYGSTPAFAYLSN